MKHKATPKFWLDYFQYYGASKAEATMLAAREALGPGQPRAEVEGFLAEAAIRITTAKLRDALSLNPREVPPWLV